MNYEYLFDLANNFIEEVFDGIKDKSGCDYVTHPRRVASKIEDMPSKIVALLHDTIEDTYVTDELLKEIGFPKEIIDAVVVLTIRESEDYNDYINRVISSNNKLALTVKKADMEDNMNEERLNKLEVQEKERLLNKYKDKYILVCKAYESL